MDRIKMQFVSIEYRRGSIRVIDPNGHEDEWAGTHTDKDFEFLASESGALRLTWKEFYTAIVACVPQEQFIKALLLEHPAALRLRKYWRDENGTS